MYTDIQTSGPHTRSARLNLRLSTCGKRTLTTIIRTRTQDSKIDQNHHNSTLPAFKSFIACVNDESRLSFSASSSGRYLSSFSILTLDERG